MYLGVTKARHAGDSPSKQLFSHPLESTSPASDDAQSTADAALHETQADPNTASAALQSACHPSSSGFSTARLISALHLVSEPAQPADATGIEAAQGGEQQLPLIGTQQKQHQLHVNAAVVVSKQSRVPKGQGAWHDPTQQSLAEADAPWAEPIQGKSPARGKYVPDRYKPYSLLDAEDLSHTHQSQSVRGAEAQVLSTQMQSLSTAAQPNCHRTDDAALNMSSDVETQLRSSQTHTQLLTPQSPAQPLGQSPKQAALHKLKSLTVKLSQSISTSTTKQGSLPPVDHHTPAVPLPRAPVGASGASTVAPGASTESQTVSAGFQYTPGAQRGLDAAQARPGTALVNPAGREPAASQAREDKEQGNQAVPISTAHSVKAPAVLLSPRRSISMARLRSQSLAKHWQEPRSSSGTHLPLVPIHSDRSDTAQQLDTPVSCPTAAHRSPARQLDCCWQEPTAAGTVVVEQFRTASQLAKAESAGISQWAGDKQTSSEEDAVALDLGDIDLVEHQNAPSASPSASPSAVPADAPSVTCSAGLPLIPSKFATSEAAPTSQSLHTCTMTFQPEGAEPTRLTSHALRSPSSANHPQQESTSPALREHADHSGVQANAARRSSTSCVVAVCIRSSDTGATVSLEVQTHGATDSDADLVPSPGSTACEAHTAAGQTHAQAPATAAQAQDREICCSSQAVTAEASQAAAGQTDVEAAGKRGLQLSKPAKDGRPSAESAADDAERQPEPRAVSRSPEKQGSQGVGFMSRLEGSLRSLLGRGCKQQVRHWPELADQEKLHTAL